ncbi:MAG TPA: hypothetical protein VF041_14725 [Gemmatimonadaceae bacterium]
MRDGPAPAPREQGWLRIVLALAAFLLVPHAPGLQALLPVVETLLLLLPVLSVCFLLGWWHGGSFWVAMVWLALTVWLFVLPAPSGVSDAYYDLARAWGLIVGAAFGVVCLVGRQRTFLDRALSAVGLAILLGVMLAAIERTDVRRAREVFAEEFATRNAAAAAVMEESSRMIGDAIGERLPGTASFAVRFAAMKAAGQPALSRLAVPLYPALLALEALAACALAWGLHFRLSRARIGPPLAPFRNFGFTDQLIWAVVAGITLMVLPTLAPLATPGENLVVFFGALYALRGYGIFAWFASRRLVTVSVTVVLVTLLITLEPFVATIPAAVGLGLSDTWFDWRRRASGKS